MTNNKFLLDLFCVWYFSIAVCKLLLLLISNWTKCNFYWLKKSFIDDDDDDDDENTLICTAIKKHLAWCSKKSWTTLTEEDQCIFIILIFCGRLATPCGWWRWQ